MKGHFEYRYVFAPPDKETWCGQETSALQDTDDMKDGPEPSQPSCLGHID